ncbi:MAG TPA: CoA pyrophosphatase [Parvularcula sp.]|nr:CoA pyrophosphatase [Parvularcula sp.]HBS30695.1 CoA pyrophosphatase [Parvularcula sp.]HBS36243.1 CoA pyrophosphatase [Parvularcula sp.]
MLRAGQRIVTADWRRRIGENLSRADAQRVRALFSEINPHLAADARFENRWTTKRQDAAVLIPIIDRREGPTVLLTVRSSDLASHAGQISFPGGRVDPGDADRVATALRETEEEVGIPRAAVDVVGALGVHHGGLGFEVTPIVGVVDAAAPIRPDPREVAEIFEAPLDWFADLRNHKTEEREHLGVRYKMFAAPYGRFHIWGLTAGILRSLAEILQPDSGGVQK